MGYNDLLTTTRALIKELNRHAASGLITREALVLINQVQQQLNQKSINGILNQEAFECNLLRLGIKCPTDNVSCYYVDGWWDALEAMNNAIKGRIEKREG